MKHKNVLHTQHTLWSGKCVKFFEATMVLSLELEIMTKLIKKNTIKIFNVNYLCIKNNYNVFPENQPRVSSKNNHNQIVSKLTAL